MGRLDNYTPPQQPKIIELKIFTSIRSGLYDLVPNATDAAYMLNVKCMYEIDKKGGGRV